MICPIMSVRQKWKDASGYTHDSFVDCKEEDCAWHIKDEMVDCCIIFMIGNVLYERIKEERKE